MRRVTVASVLLALAALPAVAQAPTAQPETGARARNVAPTGVTKPPSSGNVGALKGINEAEMLKAQQASAARDKAWDSKMKTTMGSICRGC